MSTKAIAKAFADRHTLYSMDLCEACLIRKAQAEALLPYLPQEGELVKKSQVASSSSGNAVPSAQVQGTSRPVSLPATRHKSFFPRGKEVKRKSVGVHPSNPPQTSQVEGTQGPATTFDEILHYTELPQIAVFQTIKRILPESPRIIITGKPASGDRSSLPSQQKVSPPHRVLQGNKPRELLLTASTAQDEETPQVLRVGRPHGIVIEDTKGRQASKLGGPVKSSLNSMSVAREVSFSQPTPKVVEMGKRITAPSDQSLKHVFPRVWKIPTSKYNTNFTNYNNHRPVPPYIPSATSSAPPTPTYKPYFPPAPVTTYTPYRAPHTVDEIFAPRHSFSEPTPQVLTPPAHPEFKLVVTPPTTLPIPNGTPINRDLLYPPKLVSHQRSVYKSVITASTSFSASLLSSASPVDVGKENKQQRDSGFQMVGFHNGVPTYVPMEGSASEVWEEISLDSPVREGVCTSFEGMGVPVYTVEEEKEE
jgi:hypothetical protein